MRLSLYALVLSMVEQGLGPMAIRNKIARPSGQRYSYSAIQKAVAQARYMLARPCKSAPGETRVRSDGGCLRCSACAGEACPHPKGAS